MAVSGDGVCRRGFDDLVFLSDQRQRAVRLARPSATIRHLPRHGPPSFDRSRSLYSASERASMPRRLRTWLPDGAVDGRLARLLEIVSRRVATQQPLRG